MKYSFPIIGDSRIFHPAADRALSEVEQTVKSMTGEGIRFSTRSVVAHFEFLTAAPMSPAQVATVRGVVQRNMAAKFPEADVEVGEPLIG